VETMLFGTPGFKLSWVLELHSFFDLRPGRMCIKTEGANFL